MAKRTCFGELDANTGLFSNVFNRAWSCVLSSKTDV